jgi:hypothetical protein
MAMLVFSPPRARPRSTSRPARSRARASEGDRRDHPRRRVGRMDITEPDAGSDMAALRDRREQDEHGNWFVTGQKIFITSGHGKYHFVIARTEKPKAGDDPFAGLGGLSMFLVPAYEDLPDGKRKRIVKLDRIEEKLGHHGSATASLDYERAPAQLVGRRGEGFKYMLTLMNNARVGVGSSRIGLSEAAYRPRQALRRRARLDGQDHRSTRDDRRLPRRDGDRRPGHRALAGDGERLPRGARHQAQPVRRLPRGPERALEGGARAHELGAHKKISRRFTPLLKYLPRRRRSSTRGARCRSTAATATSRSIRRRSSCATRS